MALITNNISGSSADSWRIGITGSVRIGNPGANPFPSMPGSDVDFFVSGSRGGKGTSGVSVFGGDAVVSGSLTVGTGSVTITSNEIIFQGGIAKIYSGSNGLVFEDSSGTKSLSSLSGGGGGGDSIFTAASNVAAYTTSSIAIGQAAAANTKGADLFFFVSGSKTSGGRPTSGVASFGGDLSVTGTLYLGDGSVAGIYNRDGGALLYSTSPTSVVLGQDVILNTNIIKANDGNTAITLSSTNVTVAGDITGSNALVNGALTTTGNATIGGNIVADAEEAKSIFVNVGANDVTIGSANGNVVIGNDLQITGNDIKSSTGATAITLAGSSVTVAGNITGSNSLLSGDLAVNGGDITTTAATATVFNSNATTVNIAGAGTSVSIGSSAGLTTINNNLTVKGDLYISGTVTTIDSTVTEIQDPVVGLGFSSGSIALAAGDRGFIGGITGTGNNVAFVWSNSNSSFVATRTTSSPTGSVSTAVDITALQPVRASRFDVGGVTAFITSSNGNDLTARGPGIVSLVSTGNKVVLNPTAAQILDFQFGGTPHAELTASAGAPKFGAIGSRQLILSGAILNLNAGPNGINLQRDGVPYGVITGSTGVGGGLRIAGGDSFVVAELTLSGSTVTIGANAGTTTVKGGTLVGDQATQNLFNSVATTLNIGGAATSAVNIGGNGGTATISNPTVTLANAANFNVNGANPTIAGTSTGVLTLFNANLTSVNAFGAATNINVGADGSGALYLKNATVNISGSSIVAGNSTLGSDSTDKIYFSGSAASSLIPDTNNAYDLGSPALRWRNMYTGDLHLRNERGDWTIIEEREFLSITNNHSGRRYKFLMEEI